MKASHLAPLLLLFFLSSGTSGGRVLSSGETMSEGLINPQVSVAESGVNAADRELRNAKGEADSGERELAERSRVLNDTVKAVRAVPVKTADTRSLFERVFGRKQPQQSESFQVRLLLDGNAVGPIDILANVYNGDVKIDANRLIAYVSSTLKSEAASALGDLINKRGYIEKTALQRLGFHVLFSQRRMLLIVDSPADYRHQRTVYILGHKQNPAKEIHRSGTVSGYVNIYNSYLMKTGSIQQDPLYHLRLQSVLNLANWVIEGESSYNSARQDLVQTPYFSIQHSLGRPSLRFVAGSLDFSRLGFMPPLSQIGIGIAQSWQYDPNIVSHPTYEKELHLDQDSRVQISINGDLVYDEKQTKGRILFQRFPMQWGVNRITVSIRDDMKQTTISDEIFIQDDLLLDASKNEFKAVLAKSYQNRDAFFDGTVDDLKAVLMIRQGIHDRLTLMGYAQVRKSSFLMGVGPEFASPLGFMSSEIAISQSRFGQYGFGFRALLRGYLQQASFLPWVHRWNLDMSYRNSSFSSTGKTRNQNRKLRIEPNLELLLSSRTHVKLGLAYQGYRTGNRHRLELGLSYFYRHDDWYSQLTYGMDEERDGTQRHHVNMSWTWTNLEGLGRVQVRQDSRTKEQQLDWTGFQDGKTIPAMHVSSRVRNKDHYAVATDATFGGFKAQFEQDVQNSVASRRISAQFAGQRGRVQVSSTSKGKDRYDVISAQTAIAFADGIAAISKPIQDSFAILYPHRSIRGNHVSFSSGAAIDWLGPAVVTDLQSFRQTRINIEDNDLPVGVDLGQYAYYIEAQHKSGTAIQVGQAGHLLLTGQIKDNGKLITYMSGRIEKEDGSGKTKSFFCNRQGRFYIIGLEPGRYRLSFNIGRYRDVVIDIPDSPSGRVSAGILELTTID